MTIVTGGKTLFLVGALVVLSTGCATRSFYVNSDIGLAGPVTEWRLNNGGLKPCKRGTTEAKTNVETLSHQTRSGFQNESFRVQVKCKGENRR